MSALHAQDFYQGLVEETKPKRRFPIFWALYIGCIALVVLLIVILARTNGNQGSGILIRDQGKWQRVANLPTNPERIAVGDAIWIVDENQDLLRFENFNGAIWSWYQLQEGDTLDRLAETFDTSAESIKGSNDNLRDSSELPIGEWIWIQGYRTYTRSDIGLSPSANIRDLFAVGYQAWLLAQDGDDTTIYFFDSQSWHMVEKSLFAGQIRQLAVRGAADGSPLVVILDSTNTLYHIENPDAISSTQLDSIRSTLDLPPTPQDIPTHLVLASDGSIFVLNDVLLRYDGAAWSMVTLPDSGVADRLTLIGFANGTLWLHGETDDFWGIALNGRQWNTYSLVDMGISQTSTIYGVTSDGTHSLFATSTGILRFDGEQWSMDSTPPLFDPVRQITLGNFNQVWAISRGKAATPQSTQAMVGVALLIAVIVALVMTLRLIPRFFAMSLNSEKRALIEKALQQPLPKPNELKSKWELGWRGALVSSSPILILGLVVIALFLVWGSDSIDNLEKIYEQVTEAFEHILPGAPDWVKEILGEFLLAGVLFVLGLPLATVAIMRTKDPEKRARIRQNMIGAFFGLLFVAIVETLFTHLAEWAEDNGDLGLPLIILIVVFIIMALTTAFILLLWLNGKLRGNPQRWLQQGDYDRALAGFDKRVASGAALPAVFGMYGAMLVIAGRFERAEEVLRKAIRDASEIDLFQTLIYQPLEQLGAALNGLGRYDEAQTTLEAAIQLNSKNAATYVHLAETYLLQNKSPEIALELLEKAHKHRRGQYLAFGGSNTLVSEIWADRAWALSLLGQRYEAENALEMAFKNAPKQVVPIYAGLLWRASKAMQIQRNKSKARDYFRQSLAVDPDGAFAERSRTSLRELDGEFGFDNIGHIATDEAGGDQRSTRF